MISTFDQRLRDNYLLSQIGKNPVLREKLLELARSIKAPEVQSNSLPRNEDFEQLKSNTVDETYEFLANENPEKLYAIMKTDPDLFNKLAADYQAKVTGSSVKKTL